MWFVVNISGHGCSLISVWQLRAGPPRPTRGYRVRRSREGVLTRDSRAITSLVDNLMPNYVVLWGVS